MMARRRVASVGGIIGLVAGVMATALAATGASSRPTTQPTPTLPADERIAAAVAEVGRFDFLKGYELFDQILKSAQPADPAWESATFGKAVCAQQIRPITEARTKEAAALYVELVQKRPQSPLAARAMMNLGRIDELRDYGEPPSLPGARQWYQKVIGGWASDPIAGEATLRLAATHVQTYEQEGVLNAIALLEEWLKSHPDDPLASAMWQYLGDTYFFPLNDFARALACYEKADAIGLLERGREGPAYWRMAVLADRLREKHQSDPTLGARYRDLAVKYYTKIITDAPSSGKGYAAQQALRRLGAPVPEIEIYRTGATTRPRATTPGEGGAR